MTTLVLGAGGRLGSALAKLSDCVGLTREECDITDTGAVLYAVRTRGAKVVINCAAVTDVDACENWKRGPNPLAINDEAVGDLAWECRDEGVRFCHVSSDYVIQGGYSGAWFSDDQLVAQEPFDETAPTISRDHTPELPERLGGEYAHTKLAGENAALQAGAIVVRVQWLFSRDHGGFPFYAIASILSGETAEAVNDQIGVPSPVSIVAPPLLALACCAPAGLWHLAPHGRATPAEWLRLACEVCGSRPNIREVSRTSRRNHHLRPRWSVLDPSRAERFLGITMPTWQDALRQELAT